MKENMKTIMFIASIALNVFFVATYFTYKLPLFAEVHQPSGPGAPLFLQMDLTSDQLAQFRSERDQFRARLQELGQEIKANQIELIDLIGASSPDQQAIDAKQGEIQRLQGAVQDRVISHFLKGGSLLTPEQRTRFFQLIKGRIETEAQACPPWMKSPDQGRPGENENE
jgi:Spy/CpxP family protein refolding chaperone